MPKLESKYTSYSPFDPTKTTKLRKSEGRIVGINEPQLKRILEEYYGIEIVKVYEKMKDEHIERVRKGFLRFDRSLYVDGVGSVSIMFERNTVLLTYGDGRQRKFTISLT